MKSPVRTICIKVLNYTTTGRLLGTREEMISADSFAALETEMSDLIPNFKPEEWDVYWQGECG